MDIIGTWIPQCSTEGDNDLHYASLLMLWKPWCDHMDLKEDGESWKDAYDAFMQQRPSIKHFASNAQYRYECKEVADKDECGGVHESERQHARVESFQDTDGEDEESEVGGNEDDANKTTYGTKEDLNNFIAVQGMTEEVSIFILKRPKNLTNNCIIGDSCSTCNQDCEKCMHSA